MVDLMVDALKSEETQFDKEKEEEEQDIFKDDQFEQDAQLRQVSHNLLKVYFI